LSRAKKCENIYSREVTCDTCECKRYCELISHSGNSDTKLLNKDCLISVATQISQQFSRVNTKTNYYVFIAQRVQLTQ